MDNAEKPKKRGLKEKTLIITESLQDKIDTLSGQSSAKNVLKGWITINRSPKTSYAAEWYYTGANIHETRQEAMAVAAHARVGVCYIEFIVPDREYI